MTLKIKFDSTQLLSLSITILGLAGTLLSKKMEATNREALKKEIIEEIMKKKK